MIRAQSFGVAAMMIGLAGVIVVFIGAAAVTGAAPAPASSHAAAPATIAGLDDELAQPVRVAAGGKPIDLSDAIGHAAPFYADIDGDGAADLLVGQFDDGRLRIYRNTGTTRAPLLDGRFTWFKAGADLGRVPAG